MTIAARSAKDIFMTALDKDPAERGAFVSGACGQDRELKRRVRRICEPNSSASSSEPA